MSRPLNLISLVVPAYNEEDVLPLMVPRVASLLDDLPCESEAIFVDDGSRDHTAAVLAGFAARDARIKVVELSRNYGQQTAITAGLDHAAGDAVIVLDADLQDPPELIPRMLDAYRAGSDVVFAQRIQRHGETWFKRTSAAGFYWLMRRVTQLDLPENAGEFRLMSRAVVDALARMPERHRFVRGLVAWTGFRQTAIQFDRPPRASGSTKFPAHKMFALAWQGITAFSALPLRAAALVGVLLMIVACAAGVFAAVQGLSGSSAAWPAMAALQIGLTGLVLLALGVHGDYIARIHEEIKGRPLYLVQSRHNLDNTESLPQAFHATPSRASARRRVSA